ncbi:hypothetical protein CDEST_15376 [Colletotrichum destructivum]|uniref:Uncharacterized protein n=1 Tax=Colletotrichum destructivum TaxID=34406 RepID=A0AAX4J4V3_9PEZI|nr:hypothetical protein CDEST_15376 [Colletotrichum destructivum]
MNIIYRDIVNRKTTPTSVDPDTRFQCDLERLAVAAITQTYHYMIEGRLEYGRGDHVSQHRLAGT